MMQIDDKFLRRMALLIAVNTVRNTVIEDYHAMEKITQSEMMVFNKEVANKLYTFLKLGMFNPKKEEQEKFMAALSLQYPHDWDAPTLDDSLLNSYNLVNSPDFDLSGILEN
mgnify:FL=1